ncbi:MAG TPA: hypothetical protein VFR68_10055 [Candidatus Dormibacteraeota bacterium]|nr:hypothetical protein [Candidatus Dormibacteraeota bacterium]
MNQPDQNQPASSDQPQTPRDNTGWAQPPAPQGPPGAFVDRQPVSSGQPLPPGAGSPLQPGPPLSVQAPIRDTTINLTVLLVAAGAALVVIILLAILIGSLSHH